MNRGASLLHWGRKERKFRRPLIERIQTVIDAKQLDVEAYRTSRIALTTAGGVYRVRDGQCIYCTCDRFSTGSKMYQAVYVLVRERSSTRRSRGLARIHFGCIPGA